MNASLTDIQKKVNVYAARINAPTKLLPAYGGYEECQPTIAMDATGQFFYQISERGQLITNEPASSEDDLLYSVFRDISFSMAVAFELKNRNPRHDFRRLLFAKQLELLAQLNAQWKEKKQAEQLVTLKDNPFDDNSMLRMDYFDQLRKMGKTYEQAMSEANKKFPVPPPSGFPQQGSDPTQSPRIS